MNTFLEVTFWIDSQELVKRGGGVRIVLLLKIILADVKKALLCPGGGKKIGKKSLIEMDRIFDLLIA
jgi:hypothetical protein